MEVSFVRHTSGLPIPSDLLVIFKCPSILHEIAHKLQAQHYRLWTEFQLTLTGAFITIPSMLAPSFKTVSPRAATIEGTITKAEAEKMAVPGPLTNIVPSRFAPQPLL